MVLALVPIEIAVGLGGQGRTRHGGRGLDKFPGRKRWGTGIPRRVWVRVFAVDSAEEPPAGGIAEGSAHHFPNPLCVPKEIEVGEGAAVIPGVVAGEGSGHTVCLPFAEGLLGAHRSPWR